MTIINIENNIEVELISIDGLIIPDEIDNQESI